MNDNLIYILFLIFFLIHEFEELIMIERWLVKHRSDLQRRFPLIFQRVNKMTEIDTRKFSVIVAEEFLIVSILTILSIWTDNVIYWYCGFSAFGIHLIIHLFQFIAWRGYIPAIITTALCMPYFIYAFDKVSSILSLEELLIFAAIGFIFGSINLLCMHKLVVKI